MSHITRLNFNTLADGGDDATGAFHKLDANDNAVDIALTAAEQTIAAHTAALGALGNAAGKSVGTAAGTVAAGDDARFFNRGRRNQLINGGLRTNLRAFAGGAVAANTYGYDRWRAFGSGSSLTRSADLTTLTLNGTIGQIIESPNAGGATVTVSLANPSGPVTVNIRPDATTAGVTGIIPAGAGLQSTTLVIPASITGNVFLQLSTAGATTFDGPAKRAGVQLEFGSFASAFEYQSVPEEVSQCLRYYYPMVATTGNFALAVRFVSTAVILILPFPVQMRATPTGTISGNLVFNENGSALSMISMAASGANPNGGSVTATVANGTAGSVGYVSSNGVRVAFDAEL